MRSVMWTYPCDLLDEGIDAALDAMQSVGGQAGISLATSYHHGRFLGLHGRQPRVHFAEGSRVYFRPDASRYGELQPKVASLVADRDPLADIVRQAERRDMVVHSWTVCLHNTSVGTEHPDLCQQTPFGDPLLHSLCPSNPSIREYVVALTADLAHARGLAEIELEAVGFMDFAHGYHHEKTGVPLDAWHEFLMGLCFCPSCRQRASTTGIDTEGLQRRVRSDLTWYFERDEIPGTAAAADVAMTRGLLDHDFGGYLRTRVETVGSLLNEIRAATARTSLSAYLGGGAAGTQGGWAEGLLAEHLASDALIDTALVWMYGLGPEDVRRAYATACRTIGDHSPVGGMISAIAPNVATGAEAAASVRALADAGAKRVNIYNYGLMRRPALAAIGQALA